MPNPSLFIYLPKLGSRVSGSSFWTSGEMNKALHSFCIIHHIGLCVFMSYLALFKPLVIKWHYYNQKEIMVVFFLGKVDQLYRVW